jgi:hypothetical protein
VDILDAPEDVFSLHRDDQCQLLYRKFDDEIETISRSSSLEQGKKLNHNVIVESNVANQKENLEQFIREYRAGELIGMLKNEQVKMLRIWEKAGEALPTPDFKIGKLYYEHTWTEGKKKNIKFGKKMKKFARQTEVNGLGNFKGIIEIRDGSKYANSIKNPIFWQKQLELCNKAMMEYGVNEVWIIQNGQVLTVLK